MTGYIKPRLFLKKYPNASGIMIDSHRCSAEAQSMCIDWASGTQESPFSGEWTYSFRTIASDYDRKIFAAFENSEDALVFKLMMP